jgi:hypothetical protein
LTDSPVPAPPAPAPDILFILSDGTKVKRRLLRMRACNERNVKGKICAGHLKRWYHLTPAAREKFGDSAELYRCERCHTIYLPNPDEPPRTATLAW